MAYDGPIPLGVPSGGTGRSTIAAGSVLCGNTAGTVTLAAPTATTGIPLVSQGSSSTPSFTTAVVAGGGTGDTSFTAYSVITGGTTSTGALQNVSGVGSSGQVLTSNGASALPTWQAVSSSASTYFSAHLTSTQSSVTGDNTNYTIVYDTAGTNVGAAYNTGTGAFTAPVTGFYAFNTVLQIQGITSSHNQVFLQFVCSTSAHSANVFAVNPFAVQEGGATEIEMNGSLFCAMSSGDTMVVKIDVVGGSKVVNVIGGSTLGTSFSGFRVA